MNFGQAIELAKRGQRVARADWNGKGMFVFLQKGVVEQLPSERPALIGGVDRDLFVYEGRTRTRMPCLVMQTADGSLVTGWLASQTDILAEDWEVAA